MALVAEVDEKKCQQSKTKQSSKCLSKKDLDYKKKLRNLLTDYKSCMIISKEYVSSAQFGSLRKEFRGRARFLMGKNIVIRGIIREYVEETNELQWAQLLPYIRGQCGLVFTNESVAKLRKEIEANKRQTAVKYNQIAPTDVFIPPGPTGLDPTHLSSGLWQNLGIITRINRGQIDIEEEIHLIKKGEKITRSQAMMASQLNLKPFWFGVKVLYVFIDGGELFDAKMLDITMDDVANSFTDAIQQIAGFTTELNHYTTINVPFSLLSAYKNVLSLGLELSGNYSWEHLDQIKVILENAEAYNMAPYRPQGAGGTMAKYEEDSEEYSSSKAGPGCFGDDSSSDDDSSSEGGGYIGLSVGGAKDVNNFRQCIEQNKIPNKGSITYNGLLYEYYFDTKTRKSVSNYKGEIDMKYNDNDDDKKEDDGSNLFYPSYCYAKVQKMDFINNKISDTEFEYYMTVGMNSNIKKNEFKRKNLNLVILLDVSGSMYSQFRCDNEYKSKMRIANESCVALMDHLTPKDRFALVTFQSDAQVIQSLEFVNDIDMKDLKKRILSIRENGGTYFEGGYNKVIQLFENLFKRSDYALNTNVMDDMQYENRVILITDAQPNRGRTSSGSLLNMVSKNAENENKIYTTFIGVGLDFNASLIEDISQTRGCNYYSVKSGQEFKEIMDDEFEFMVTPLVFNVCLKLNCEGSGCQIDKVYGSKQKLADKIMETGEIRKIHTLFPTKKSKKKGGTKGGIQLIRLKKDDEATGNINVEIEVSFEDRNGKKYKNTQFVTFEAPKLKKLNNDMIEDDSEEEDQNIESLNFYDNIGIRKGILLCKYAEIMLNWIDKGSTENQQIQIFKRFLNYFKKEMIKCKDDDLQREVDLMQKILNW